MAKRQIRHHPVLIHALTLATPAIVMQGCALYRDGTHEVSTYIRQRAEAGEDVAEVYAHERRRIGIGGHSR